MDATRMSQGQRIAGAGGGLLIIFMFLPWLGRPSVGGIAAQNLNAWDLTAADLFFFITAMVAIAAALTAGGFTLPGVSLNGATFLLGTIGTVMLVYLLIFDMPTGASRKFGLFFSLIATGAIAYGGWTSALEDAVPAGTSAPPPDRYDDRDDRYDEPYDDRY